jgi:chemotaxis-related protein WspD
VSSEKIKQDGLIKAGLERLMPGFADFAKQDIDDCWNKIGVIGNGTCTELTKFIHCRNCPVYSTAGARLLDRELPVSYRREWTEHFSSGKKQAATGKVSVVVFRIGTEWLALPTGVFQEIAEWRPIHSLPHRRQGIVLGLANVRGGLLICVSLGRLLGAESEGGGASLPGMHDRLVVAEWQGRLLAFPVNEVHGVHRYQPEELREVPATVSRGNPSFSRGLLNWMGTSIGCLDEELLFSTLNRSLM